MNKFNGEHLIERILSEESLSNLFKLDEPHIKKDSIIICIKDGFSCLVLKKE